MHATNGKESGKREHEETREERRQRKKKSRWGGDEKEKTFIPGMPTVLPSNLSKTQEESYLVQLQIEEISRKLRSGDLGIPANPEERSPSPEPIYSSDGKRLNTREYRTRKKLEEDRHHLIQQMMSLVTDYKPPSDYKPPVVRVSDKVMIPQEEHPDINFVGLLIGPRGNTLKAMERDTGAKIIIRGKGSVKEGKVGRKDGQPLPGEDEPLHAYVTANNPESVKKAVEKIKEIIRQGVEVPEGQNDLRRMQLRELALLNGTLRENDGPRCSNCGASTHKSWQCPDKPNVTINVVCTNCGGAGHIARDCRQKLAGAGPSSTCQDRTKIDEEYMSLMAELGEGPPPPAKDPADRDNVARRPGTVDLFERQARPRAIGAPPTRPEANNNSAPTVGQPLRPGMIPARPPPPPWNEQQMQMSHMQPGMPQGAGGHIPNINRPPPPGPPGTTGTGPPVPPWQMAMGGQPNYPGAPPPPGVLRAPPPPPPPGAQGPDQMAAWMRPTRQPVPPPPHLPPWQQGGVVPPPPGPVPPPVPRPPPPGMYPWQQQTGGYVGVPQPVQPPPMTSQAGSGQGGAPGVDLNALAGLPSLLAPPPPPPPPS